MQLDVLPDKDADSNAAHVELVEKGMDLRDVAELKARAVFAHELLAQLVHTARHSHKRRRMPIINVAEQVVEDLLALGTHGHCRAAYLDKRLLVPLAHPLH